MRSAALTTLSKYVSKTWAKFQLEAINGVFLGPFRIQRVFRLTVTLNNRGQPLNYSQVRAPPEPLKYSL